jgi:hypothetical protein
MVQTAQLFTGFVGLVLAPFLIIRLSSSLGFYKYLAVFFIFGIRDITWSWVLPKNDPFPFICFLMGVDLFYNNYILKTDNEKISKLFLAALVVGIGTASKLTNSYIVIFSLFYFLSFYYHDVITYIKKIKLPKVILIITLGLGVGASVFLFRNFINTGNPFYPVAKFGFPNIFLTPYADRPEAYSMPGSWLSALNKIKGHIIDQPQILFLLLAAIFIKKTRILSAFYVLMIVFMAKQTGPMFRFRMTAIFLILALILFIQVLVALKNNKKLMWVLTFIVLITAKIQIEKLVKIPFTYYQKSVHEICQRNVEHLDEILKANQTNRENKKYVYFPKEEIMPYFSRFPFISNSDSVEQYRYNYYKD